MQHSSRTFAAGLAKGWAKHNSLILYSQQFPSHSPEEVQIPVPWGHVAGKWWNRDKSDPVIALHGWMGHSSTFDGLIPLLPKELSVLAIDLPGYGKSSHLPAGCYYHRFNNVVVLRRIIQHYKWEKLSLLGHALGGSLAFLYSSLFPNTIKSLSIINAPMTPIPIDEVKYIEAAGGLIDKFLDRDYLKSSGDKTEFTREEMQDISATIFDHKLSIDVIDKLLERGGDCVSDDKCYFSHDKRLIDSRLSGWNHREILQMAEELKTHVLVIMYDQSPYYMPKEEFLKFWEAVKTKALSASMHIVQGERHDFLSKPENSSDIINEHLQKYHLDRKDKKS